MTERRDKHLDETLVTGRRSSDPEVDALAEQAERVREGLSVLAPEARHERALFVQGIAGRSRSLPALRFLAPAAIVVAGIVALAGFGRNALPGQTLWPVREALSTVGLAATPEEEIDRRIDSARAQCREAADLEISHPEHAQDLVMGAIGDLDRAKALAEDLDPDQRSTYLLAITEIEDWAIEMIVETSERTEEGAGPAEDEDDSGPGEDSGPSDNSGPGSGDDDSGSGGGDDSGGDDNSGSGSDDSDGDDSSGSGGGDDSGGDDSSGSGSGDSDGDDSSGSGGGDDSSGSGSGDSGGDDSSGSGSGDSGGDSSGSGSGDDD